MEIPDFSKQTVLITGGLGFVGSNLASMAARRGATIRILDNRDPAYGANMQNLDGFRDACTVIDGDVRNVEDVEKAMEGVDLVYHLAAQVSHVDSMTDPYRDLDINARGTLVLLEQCRRAGRPVRVVYGGTRGQYGKPVRTPVFETDNPVPVDIYGVNKHAAEGYCMVYGSAYGLETVSVRIGNCYGPRHQMKHAKYGIMNWFVRLAMEDRAISVYGDGSQVRDYLYIEDAVKAMLLAGTSPKAVGKVYNVGSGKGAAFVDIVKTVIRAAGHGSIKYVPWPDERLAIDSGDFIASTDLIRQDLGWAPETGLEDGFARTVRFFDENRQYYFV